MTTYLNFTDTEVVPGRTYIYQITAINSVGESSPGTCRITFIGVPTGPLDLRVDKEGNALVISWKPPISDGGMPITGYILLRGIDEQSLAVFRQLDPITSYIDDTVDGGQGYYYSVKAVNNIGPGSSAGPVYSKAPGKGPEVEDEISIWLIILVFILTLIVVIGSTILITKRQSELPIEKSREISEYVDEGEGGLDEENNLKEVNDDE